MIFFLFLFGSWFHGPTFRPSQRKACDDSGPNAKEEKEAKEANEPKEPKEAKEARLSASKPCCQSAEGS